MTEAAIPVLVIGALALANALFVAAEFAIVGAPRANIDHLAAQGSRLAARVARILADPRRQDRYIATTQVGISAASLGLGMYGEQVIAEYVEGWLAPLDAIRWVATHALSSGIAVGILTYVHIVIGEMVPKGLALKSAMHTSMYVSPIIEALQVALLPLIVVLNAAGNGLLAVIGIRRAQNEAERYHTSEELQFIIEESHERGLLRGESGRILRELFEFGNLTAGEVMVPRVRLVGIAAGTAIDDAQGIVRQTPHTRYPVYSGDLDHIEGSVHIKTLLRHIVAGTPVTLHDARPLPHVPTTTPLDEVLAAMRRARAHMAVVMDEHGGTAGVVTIGDLFEEVVGDIDEDRGRPPISKDALGRLVVRGTVRLTSAGDALGVTLEHPDVQSVSGLVLALLDRGAQVGDVVTWGHVRIEVTAVAGRGVAEAAMTKLPSPPARP
ncbi:MAG TPA: hemolysin family protein [Vicinamibacterales bacterium]|jgi:CBS domain containing-hemolysin-like protein|nr:hemolysin family protein [Vicinamibacterales bacterium]